MQQGAHRVRTRRAEHFLQAPHADERADFCLYLRPFLTSRNLTVRNSRYLRRFFPSMDRFYGRRIDLETVLAMALEEKRRPLIAIGDTGFRSGTAALSSNEASWRSLFEVVSRRASCIIMIPLPRPSTMWEIDTILDRPDLLRKTLFIMPMRLRSGVTERLEPYWLEITRTLRTRGVDFPVFDPNGALFVLREGGRLRRQIDAGGFDIDYLEAVLQGLLDPMDIEAFMRSLAAGDRGRFETVIERFVYIDPRDGRLHARPLPEGALPPEEDEICAALLERNLLLRHRSQNGAQAFWENELHPVLLDSLALGDMMGRHANRLADKGKIVVGTSRDLSARHAALASLQALPLSLPAHPAALSPKPDLSFAYDLLLRPEEEAWLAASGRE